MSKVDINIAQIVEHEPKSVLAWASTVNENHTLDESQNEISQVVDAWAKEIGEKGADPNREIASFIRKAIEPVVTETEDELLATLFDVGSIGEFDEKVYEKWTTKLNAYDAVKGGNIPKSFLDVKSIKPAWKHAQVETELRYVDLRKNGYKTIAKLVSMAEQALRAKRFADLYKQLDAAITTGSVNRITVSGGKMTEAKMDELELYLFDRVENGEKPTVIGANKLMRPVMKQLGNTGYLSDSMKNDLNRYGQLFLYNGMNLIGVSGSKTVADNKPMIPQDKIFGFVGKIGEVDTKGEVRVYETFDNNEEVIHIKVTGYEYGFAVLKPEKVFIADVTA